MDLTCPKCQAPMRQYERNGVTVDQCQECRGVFLDRGELEHLLDAEDKFNGRDAGRAAMTQPVAGQHPPGYAQPPRRRYGSPDSPDSPYGGWGHHRRRRKSFLSELFD